ncbi:hypothetical protein GCM10020331_007530 [Ectobacillus funiculus]
MDMKPFLEDISLDIHSGEFVTLTGPNGAAKIYFITNYVRLTEALERNRKD